MQKLHEHDICFINFALINIQFALFLNFKKLTLHFMKQTISGYLLLNLTICTFKPQQCFHMLLQIKTTKCIFRIKGNLA